MRSSRVPSMYDARIIHTAVTTQTRDRVCISCISSTERSLQTRRARDSAHAPVTPHGEHTHAHKRLPCPSLSIRLTLGPWPHPGPARRPERAGAEAARGGPSPSATSAWQASRGWPCWGSLRRSSRWSTAGGRMNAVGWIWRMSAACVGSLGRVEGAGC